MHKSKSPLELRTGGLWRGVGVGRPEPRVGQHLLNDRGLINEGYDRHRAATAGAWRRIRLT